MDPSESHGRRPALTPAVVDHRTAILRAIGERPGATVQELMRIVGCARSPVRYHLEALRRANLVTMRRIGGRVCAFARETVPRTGELGLRQFFASATRARIARALLNGGPLSQDALAVRTLLSRRLVGYHLQVLSEHGFVEKTGEGAPFAYAGTARLAQALHALRGRS